MPETAILRLSIQISQGNLKAMQLVYGYEYTPAAHLLVTDEDAADFLQSQFSNDLQPFETGKCTYGLWLDVKGKVIADSVILCEGNERFRIFSEHSLSATIAGKLEHHIIADDVDIEQLPEGSALALIGNEAANTLQSLDLKAPSNGTFTCMDELYIYPGRRSLEPSFELWSPSATKIADLRAHLIQAGVEFVDAQRIEPMRLEAGIPSVPAEMGPADLPGEGALVGNGVSLTKGCYLGQEVVARMHNVGRAQRVLFKVSGEGRLPVCPVKLTNEDLKEVGELRSAFAMSHGWLGVAMLKIRHVEIGDRLRCGSGNVQIEQALRCF